jgi:hypothetical protein
MMMVDLPRLNDTLVVGLSKIFHGQLNSAAQGLREKAKGID